MIKNAVDMNGYFFQYIDRFYKKYEDIFKNKQEILQIFKILQKKGIIDESLKQTPNGNQYNFILIRIYIILILFKQNLPFQFNI